MAGNRLTYNLYLLPKELNDARWQQLQHLARPRRPEHLPCRFDRRRIYVLPTRFGLFVAVLLSAMLLGALNYNNNPALLLALLLATVSIASAISAQPDLADRLFSADVKNSCPGTSGICGNFE